MEVTITDTPLAPLHAISSPPVFYRPPKHHGWPGPSQKKRRLWKRRQGGNRK